MLVFYINDHVIFFEYYRHVNILYYGIVFLLIFISLTYFVYWIYRKIAKKKVLQIRFRNLTSHFGMNKAIFMNMFFIHACVKFCDFEYVWYVFNEVKVFNGSKLLFYDLPKRGSAEILARSSISSESQIKVNFKVTASR